MLLSLEIQDQVHSIKCLILSASTPFPVSIVTRCTLQPLTLIMHLIHVYYCTGGYVVL